MDDAELDKFNKVLAENRNLINILHYVQDTFGYISIESAKIISDKKHIPLSRIYSTATFYNGFKISKQGKHVIRCCLGTACKVKHNQKNLDFVKKKLGIESGETTSDGMFSLETVNCFGACSLAPVVEVDGKLYANVTTDKLNVFIDKIIESEK